jgi:hypothetical protein
VVTEETYPAISRWKWGSIGEAGAGCDVEAVSQFETLTYLPGRCRGYPPYTPLRATAQTHTYYYFLAAGIPLAEVLFRRTWNTVNRHGEGQIILAV